MSRFFPIVVVDNEVVYQATHCPAHAQRTEDESPHDFVEQIRGSGHNEYANGEENGFGDQGVEPEEKEGPDVDDASFLGGFDIILRGYDWLVGVGKGHDGFL